MLHHQFKFTLKTDSSVSRQVCLQALHENLSPQTWLLLLTLPQVPLSPCQIVMSPQQDGEGHENAPEKKNEKKQKASKNITKNNNDDRCYQKRCANEQLAMIEPTC